MSSEEGPRRKTKVNRCKVLCPYMMEGQKFLQSRLASSPFRGAVTCSSFLIPFRSFSLFPSFSPSSYPAVVGAVSAIMF